MDVAELRSNLETSLGLIAMLTSGENISPEDLKGIEELAESIKAGLAVTPEETKRFPGGHFVFRVRRVQYAKLSVEAPDLDLAYCKAAELLQDNVEALRFTWDHQNLYDLSPLELEREPGASE